MRETRGLGRGLSALMGEPAAKVSTPAGDGLRTLPVGQLKPGPYQPRTRFDEAELDNLADSLRRSGMMQPIVARPAAGEEGLFEIVAGERRWRAAQKAQLHDVPVIVRDHTDREVLELGLVENLQRQDLGPLEEAAGYDRLRREFELTQVDVANMVGKSRAHIANMMRLLHLPPAVLAMLDNGQLTSGHGRALLGAGDAEALATRVLRDGLSVRDTERLVSSGGKTTATGSGGSSGSSKTSNEPLSADMRDLQERLREHTGLKVEIKAKGESGQLVLNYTNLEQLDDMIERLQALPRPRLVSG